MKMLAQILTESGQTVLTDQPLPQTVSQFWIWGISFVTPLIVWLIYKAVPNIPKMLLPMSTPIIGIGLGLLLNWITGLHASWIDLAKAGALAVFIRESFNQAVTKKLEEDPGVPVVQEPPRKNPTA